MTANNLDGRETHRRSYAPAAFALLVFVLTAIGGAFTWLHGGTDLTPIGFIMLSGVVVWYGLLQWSMAADGAIEKALLRGAELASEGDELDRRGGELVRELSSAPRDAG